MHENGQAFKAVLITRGRKTRRDHAVWLLAVRYEDKIYFSRHRPDSDWFQNALSDSKVGVKIGDKTIPGTASLVRDEALASRISELKYPGQRRAKEKRVTISVTLCE